jgi:hypothetical protein
VRDIITHHKGKRKVEMRFKGEDGKQMMLLPSDEFRVAWSPEVESQLSPWLQR